MSPQVAIKIERFFGRYNLKKFDKGQILVSAGSEPPGIFYLVSGHVRQYDISATGSEVVVNIFKPPAFFPMSWAMNKTPNDYFFEAAEDTEARVAPAENAVEFLKTNPDVTYDLLSRVYLGTDGLLRRMAHLMGSSASTRLMYELLVACRRFGKVQADGSHLVSISEEELARRAGLSRETVSRELGKIWDKELVRVSRKGLTVKNLQKLEEELGGKL